MLPLFNYQQEQIAQVGTFIYLIVNCSKKNLMFDNVKYRQGNGINSTASSYCKRFLSMCLFGRTM